MGFFKSLLVLAFLALSLACVHAGERCGSRCRFKKRTGKWFCKAVFCPNCFKCIVPEKCNLFLNNFKCCGITGICQRCPGCNCGALRVNLALAAGEVEPVCPPGADCAIPGTGSGGGAPIGGVPV